MMEYERNPYDEIVCLRAELAVLRAELQKVRSAAISGMDAATQHGHSLVQQAARLKAESNPDALESERAANALLTEQLQKAEADLAALRAERDRLLNWVKTGPHQMGCASLQDKVPRDQYGSLDLCNCGKSVALGYNKSTS